ncbi:MAG: aldo/keto reductase [Phycisphaerales bacterium]|nr:aldo/keto reductase [Phycisphaerales bacterium]
MKEHTSAWTRRTFLSASAGAALAGLGGLGRLWQDSSAAAGQSAALPTAALGRTGRVLPRLGLGCFPVGGLANEDDAAAVLDAALSAGVRYLDTAPSYHAGRSESRVGSAIKRWTEAHGPEARNQLYVATKTLDRTADGARRELEASLKRLGIDCVDCIQCHEVHDDWESLFAKDGALAGLEKARDEGLARHIGITCHRDPSYAISAIRRFPFVTALVPINPIDVQHHSFVRGFLPFAAENGVAVVAMKVFGGGFLLTTRDEKGERVFTPGDLLRYALAQPGVAVCVPGCETLEHVRVDAVAVRGFEQPDAAWLEGVEAKAGRHEGKSTEWYKDG